MRVNFCIRSFLFKMTVIGMKITSISELYERAYINALKEKITTIQIKSFNQIRHNYCNSMGSRLKD